MIKRRYQITKTEYKNWVAVTDLKGHKATVWMYINDFGITNKHLPAYCVKEAKALFETTQPEDKA
jgi:hypothetical protein